MLIRETFVAATPKTFTVVGNYFRIKKQSGSTAEATFVVFYKDGQKLDIDMSYSDAGDYCYAPNGFDRFDVTSTVAQDLTLQYAKGQVNSNRVIGEVSVISGELTRSKNNIAFWGYGGCAAVAAQFSHFQLWNPAASGKRVVIDELNGVAASDNMYIRQANVQCATLIGNALAKFLNGGAAASSAQLRSENNAGLLGTSGWTQITPSKGPRKFIEPIVIMPGWGILLIDTVVNTNINGDFQFFEEVI